MAKKQTEKKTHKKTEKKAKANPERSAAKAAKRAEKKTGAPAAARTPDPRLPPPGTVIQKRDRHGAVRCECKVEENGVTAQRYLLEDVESEERHRVQVVSVGDAPGSFSHLQIATAQPAASMIASATAEPANVVPQAPAGTCATWSGLSRTKW